MQQATNRGFISAAKEYVTCSSHTEMKTCDILNRYQAGEELTFDYGLLNDAVLAFYGDLLLPVASWFLNRF
jgi:hypothetical protein